MHSDPWRNGDWHRRLQGSAGSCACNIITGMCMRASYQRPAKDHYSYAVHGHAALLWENSSVGADIDREPGGVAMQERHMRSYGSQTDAGALANWGQRQ